MAVCKCSGCGDIHVASDRRSVVSPQTGIGCGWCHGRHDDYTQLKQCRWRHRVRTDAEMRALGMDLLEMHRELP